MKQVEIFLFYYLLFGYMTITTCKNHNKFSYFSFLKSFQMPLSVIVRKQGPQGYPPPPTASRSRPSVMPPLPLAQGTVPSLCPSSGGSRSTSGRSDCSSSGAARK